MKVVVERYHGLGNDYLVFDPNHNELKLDEANVKMLCDRNEGLGADGVLEGPILKEDGMHVKVWNPRQRCICGDCQRTGSRGKCAGCRCRCQRADQSD